MSLDPYSVCPCGSGKKLKFCCQPFEAEMEKVERYQQGNQPRLALQSLDAVLKKHPRNAWAVTARAEILLQNGQPGDAAETLEPLVSEQPDHRFALGLLAVASFAADGFDLAKPVIHRAFQRCLRDFPALTADLAMGIAGAMLSGGQYLSARAHLGLALRMAPDDSKVEIFRRLKDFDGNRNIPYPLRSVHELVEFTLVEFTLVDEHKDQVHKAMILSSLGCWRSAARILLKLTEHHTESARLWYNLGLCRAWDGDESLAAEALHKAAKRESDRETAVEWETLAQLLDNNVTEDRIRLLTRKFETTSISRLLTVLDDSGRFSRIDLPDQEDSKGVPVGVYYVVDEPERLQQPPQSITLDTVPNVWAQIIVFPADDEEPERVFIAGQEGETFEAALKLFSDAAGDLAKPDENETEEDETGATIPRELALLMWRWHFPDKTPLGIRRRIEKEMWGRVTTTLWPEQPLSALEGKTPSQAADNPELTVALRGAVNVLDTHCDRSQYNLSIEELSRQLQIDPPATVHFDGESSLTSLQLRRVDVKELDDEKLGMLLQRAVLIRHGGFLYDVLREVMARPGRLEKFDQQQVLITLADICREQGRQEESLEWIATGRELAKSEDNAFEKTLQWVVLELTVRLENSDDPEIMPLLRHINDYYFPKLPELRESITALAESCGVTPPWNADDAIAEVSSIQDGVWTPDKAASGAAPAAKKLWLPGQ